MEEVSARIHLHLVQVTHKPEVYHGSGSFPCNNLKIPTRSVDCLYLTEGDACHGAHQENCLLLLTESPSLLPICLDVEIPWCSIFWFTVRSGDAPGNILREGRSFAAAAILGGL